MTVVKIARGGAGGRLIGSGWRWLLLPAWLAYRPLLAVRGWLYDVGVLPAHALPAPVISVGNLAAGGTGKTPVVELIARLCQGRGARPAVLSRGYHGDGAANDEALMLRPLTVVCDADRLRGGRRALADGATVLILDDGFQHRRLGRDLDLVLIDALRPWGCEHGAGAVLPLGLLREGRSALARADALIITRADQVDDGRRQRLRQELAAYGKPVLCCRHQPTALVPLGGGEPSPPTHLAGQAVVLASGLGNPAGFERSAEELGWSVRSSLRFPDHHRFTADDLAAIRAGAAAAGAAAIVVTAKDAVKLALLPEANAAGAVPVLVLTMQAVCDGDDQTVLERLVDGALQRFAAGHPR